MDIAVWAFAYQMTGDTRYAAQAWVRLNAYLSWTDWGFGIDPATQPDLYFAHMVMGVACAYDWLYEYLPAADRTRVETRLATEAQRIATFFPNAWWLADLVQNHNWIDTAALGLAGLVLAGEDTRASSWLSMAQGNLANIQLG